MDLKEIKKKIAELTAEAQQRVNDVVKRDPVWQNLQGQIGAYEAVLAGKPEPKEEGK